MHTSAEWSPSSSKPLDGSSNRISSREPTAFGVVSAGVWTERQSSVWLRKASGCALSAAIRLVVEAAEVEVVSVASLARSARPRIECSEWTSAAETLISSSSWVCSEIMCSVRSPPPARGAPRALMLMLSSSMARPPCELAATVTPEADTPEEEAAEEVEASSDPFSDALSSGAELASWCKGVGAGSTSMVARLYPAMMPHGSITGSQKPFDGLKREARTCSESCRCASSVSD